MSAKINIAAICLAAMLFTPTARGADADVGKKLATARRLLANARDEIPASDLSSLEQKVSEAEQAYSDLQGAIGVACKHHPNLMPECAANTKPGSDTDQYMVAGVASTVVMPATEGAAMTALALLVALTYATTVNDGEDAMVAIMHAQDELGRKLAALTAAATTVLAGIKSRPKDKDRCGSCYCIGAAGSLGQRETHGDCRRDCKGLGAYRYKCGDGKVWDL